MTGGSKIPGPRSNVNNTKILELHAHMHECNSQVDLIKFFPRSAQTCLGGYYNSSLYTYTQRLILTNL